MIEWMSSKAQVADMGFLQSAFDVKVNDKVHSR